VRAKVNVMKRQTRREFVQVSFVGFGSYLVLGVGGCRGNAVTPPPVTPEAPKDAALVTLGKPALKTFSAEQFLTVCAAAERILPKDEEPGANDLGVPFYMDNQLADPDLDDWKKPFLGGLAVLNRQASKLYGTPFHLSAPEEQDQLLARWQAGKSGESRFFQILMNLTLEGAFGDPSHGGNKDGAGFVMVGFAPGIPTPGHPMDHAGMHHTMP
jgi:gluconate 2-dehydrogenase gamma chain